MKSFFVIPIVIGFVFLTDKVFGQDSSVNPGQTSGLQGFAQQQLASGLKEALSKGLQQAVTELGHEGGFLTNLHVRIPMPQQLRNVPRRSSTRAE